jgi:hypothetical protein
MVPQVRRDCQAVSPAGSGFPPGRWTMPGWAEGFPTWSMDNARMGRESARTRIYSTCQKVLFCRGFGHQEPNTQPTGSAKKVLFCRGKAT